MKHTTEDFCDIINNGISGYCLLFKNCQHLADRLWKRATGKLSLQQALDGFVGKYDHLEYLKWLEEKKK